MLALGVACQAFAAEPPASTDTQAITSVDNGFIKQAAADGMAEVQMGRMALDKSSNGKVKQLAQHVVDDHTKANDELRTLAQNKQVTLETSPSAAAQKDAADMQKIGGAKFDKAWTAAMVKGHQKAVELFTTESRQLEDADIWKFIEATLPVLHTHLDMAQQLQEQLALPDTRDKAMGSMGSMDSPFSHTNPAAATTTSPAMVAPAHSAGIPE